MLLTQIDVTLEFINRLGWNNSNERLLADYYVLMPYLYIAVRLTEPVVYKQIWVTLQQWFCCKAYDDSSWASDGRKNTINGFLTSSLNVELVYTILKGIIMITNGDFEAQHMILGRR
jgi:hypothetical protein